MLTALLAIILFVALILPHEFGHFIAAKLTGMQVNEFAFGMGPALWKKQKGETLYSIRLLPIGGYNAIEGEDGDSDSERAFSNKPTWAKLVVLFAGSAMNFLIAFLIVAIMTGVIGFPTVTLSGVTKGDPAYESGLREGDRIVAISGKDVKDWDDVGDKIQEGKEGVTVTVSRDGKEKDFFVVPRIEKQEGAADRLVIGITPGVTHSPLLAAKTGAETTVRMTGAIAKALKMIISGEAGKDEISGPVGMVSIVHQTRSQGLYYFFYLVALISVNLGLFNLLPFPALDGGRIIFVIVRKITGRAITDRVEQVVHMAGMAVLLTLMLFVTWNDIGRLLS